MANLPLKLDRKLLLGHGGGREETLELEIVSREECEPEPAYDDYLDQISDHHLEEKIQRIQSLIDGGLKWKLNDAGAKLRCSLRRHKAERERRKLLRIQKVGDGCSKSTHPQNSSSFDILSPESSTNHSHPTSSFADLFSQRLENNPYNAADVESNAFTEELGYFGHGKPKSLIQEEFWEPKKTQRSKMRSRQSPFQCLTRFLTEKDSQKHIDHDYKSFAPSSNSCSRQEDNRASPFFDKKRASPVQSALDLKKMKAQMVVLLDEEDAAPLDEVEQENEPNIREAKIYYPSRNHPESVEICYSDMDYLAPQSYLSSPIMNFYIQYLQRPECVADRAQTDYLFFNTYFYKKLEEALSSKRRIVNKDSFVKFRRWWKGVSIFQKAYIFLPIHADQHWSLVIVCIPPLEDKSGPIILHLDSLGIHSSSLIFRNIERYLTEEWKYLKDNVASVDLPIADKIWKQLPSKIKTKKIEVPQQKNEYDCGLFVLFFMEKFIEDAPERVKKKDLDMFGRKWFHPVEASDLRKRIRSLLLKEFERAKLEKNGERSTLDSPAVSGDNEEEISC